jgi:hypothetical protein
LDLDLKAEYDWDEKTVGKVHEELWVEYEEELENYDKKGSNNDEGDEEDDDEEGGGKVESGGRDY